MLLPVKYAGLKEICKLARRTEAENMQNSKRRRVASPPFISCIDD
jgi:hypothetical protein